MCHEFDWSPKKRTNNCSQNCVFGPYLESIFWTQKWVLWLHTSINLAQKRARKTHPKASPENPQLRGPCLKKNQPHKQQKPCPFGHQASVEKASSDGSTRRCLTRLEQGLSCLLLGYYDRTFKGKTGPNCDPKTRFAIWSTRQCEATKPFEKRHADGHRRTLRVQSGLGAHAVIENPIYCGRMTIHAGLDALHCPKCDTRIVKLKLTKK